MIVVDNYVINVNTSLILNEYNEFGDLCSLVIEGENIYKVNASPLSIVQGSIQYYGNNLQGAIKGASIALGKISMPPVKISGKLGIYCFPSQSIKHDDCIWFSINHIEDYYSLCRKTLKVIFRVGDITIDSSYSRLDRKVYRAHKLKNIMESRTKGENLYSYLQIKQFQVVKDPNRMHYCVNNRE